MDDVQRTELLAALEAATGPSRGLDAAIFRHIGLTEAQERHARMWCRMYGRTDLTRDDFIGSWAPAFTSSLDDALTLVPKGHMWGVGSFKTCGPWAALCFPGDTNDHKEWRGNTPALALCIAAIRARGEG